MKLVPVPESVMVYDSGSDYYDRLMVVYPDGAVYTTTLNEDDYFNYEGQFNEVSTDNSKPLKKVPSYVLARIKRMM